MQQNDSLANGFKLPGSGTRMKLHIRTFMLSSSHSNIAPAPGLPLRH